MSLGQNTFFCIDMKSFFASVECAEKGLNPFETSLVVADESRGRGALCLAITPKMKSLGAKNRCRLFEIPSNIKYQIALPRMRKYIEYAAEVYEIYLKYFSKDDIHVYSIDEAFIEQGAEVYGCAADKAQAGIVFNVALGMINQCPSLKARVKQVESQKRLIYPGTGSFYQVLSADVKNKHGFNTHGVVFDELHTQPNRALYDVMLHGSGDARRQPLYFLITTAGNDRNSICYEVHQKAKDIIEGRKIDQSFYPVIYGLNEGDDWTDEDNWYKANPSLGVTVDIEKLRQSFREAQDNPAEENLFRQLRLNEWVKQHTRWMPMAAWDLCAGEVDAEQLKGRICYAGLDLSATTDVTALVLVFPPIEADEPYKVLPYFWVPEDTLALRVRRDHVPYDIWEKRGIIMTTEGNVVDYGFIEQFIDDLGAVYNIENIVKGIVDSVVGFFTGLWNSVKEIFGNIKDAIVGAFGSIKDGVGNIISSAFDWGKNIISSLIDGIKSMVNKVGDAVKGVADKIKNFLGFSSPTKEGPGSDADEWMPNFTSMLTKGIAKGIPDIEAAVSGVINTLAVTGDTRANTGIGKGNTSVGADIANSLLQVMSMGGDSSGASTPVELSIDGQVFARLMMPKMVKEFNRNGMMIKEGGI